MVSDYQHTTVLLNEAVAALQVRPDGRYVDATFGRGGHSGRILEQLGPEGHLLAIDKDPQALATAQALFGEDGRFAIHRGSFTELAQQVEARGWTGQVDGILLDLGVSSPQLDDASRGFSFRHAGPLDMRMDPERGLSAQEWLAEADEREIARVLKVYGEERFAKRIARAIVRERGEAAIDTTDRLAAIIAAAVPTRERGKDPATRSFQAIRIQVNGELEELERCLAQSVSLLAPGGRLVVISFHSLEDRLVKRFMRDQARGQDLPPDLPIRQDQIRLGEMTVEGKPVYPSEHEIKNNPRARSAVMRVAQKRA
ncbi:MAG: 16S rRNA (cytosine(1402)-N(4))-methyltransferase RsmH [Gammaproteobacteria bacterium]|nr:16S rRNA (cytosine(1402)-N(4))-methyltransferase RsmH [Gammaproteobacteria bacterium]